MSRIGEIIHLLQNFEGITRKYVIPEIIRRLRESSYQGGMPHSLGEDSATIGTDSGDFVLLTTDSVMQEFCLAHPRAAGFNAVLANIMDIYAAGGTPTSFAVALSYSEDKIGEQLLQGVIDGSHAFNVPVVRGHTSPSASSTYIVGSATGTVKKSDVLSAGGALENDILILLFDVQGHRGKYYKMGWDTVTDRSAEDNVRRLSVMNDLAQRHLLTAAKDISTAGVIGTAGMMIEYSGMGATIDIDALDRTRPQEIEIEDWLRMFIALGFLVAADSASLREITETAGQHGLFAVAIGTVDRSSVMRLRFQGQEESLFDFRNGPLLTPRGQQE
ncbi:MAG: hypothetical protein K9W43_09620 [Candidatus Thorarchaeota archaeon]|nr:hypothetical protein [Candidatus Thorarchaeota archaeon]